MSERLKIAHVTATFWPHNTGTANVAYHNAAELAYLGHDVHIFTPRLPNTAVTETKAGFTIHRLRPLVRYGNAFFLPQLAFALAKFDIVHIHMPFYGGAEAIALLKLLSNKPVVITHHQDVQLSGIAGRISQLHDATVTTYLMKHANRVCFTSLDYAQASKFAHLLPKISYQALPNGIDIERFESGDNRSPIPDPQSPTPISSPLNLERKFILLFVGVLDKAHYFKGVENLIHAVQQLRQQDVVLLIVGKGNMQSDYQRLATRLGIGHQVHFAGYVPDEQLSELYRLADVTLLPSTTMGEAFGLVLLESLSSSTPVIASALPGVRTVVTDGQDGFLVKPNDIDDLSQKIAQFKALSPETRQQMGKNGRQKVVQTYAWSKIGGQLNTLYQEIVKPTQFSVSKPTRQTKRGYRL